MLHATTNSVFFTDTQILVDGTSRDAYLPSYVRLVNPDGTQLFYRINCQVAHQKYSVTLQPIGSDLGATRLGGEGVVAICCFGTLLKLRSPSMMNDDVLG